MSSKPSSVRPTHSPPLAGWDQLHAMGSDDSTDKKLLMALLGVAVALALGGWVFFAMVYYGPCRFLGGRRPKGLGRMQRIPTDDEQPLHVRVEALERHCKDLQAQLAASQETIRADLSEKLSDLCGVVNRELGKEAATRQAGLAALQHQLEESERQRAAKFVNL